MKNISKHLLAVMGMTALAITVTTIRYAVFLPAFI